MTNQIEVSECGEPMSEIQSCIGLVEYSLLRGFADGDIEATENLKTRKGSLLDPPNVIPLW